jgi:quinol monooxygenase YgiN
LIERVVCEYIADIPSFAGPAAPAVVKRTVNRNNVDRARKAVKVAAPEERHAMPTRPWRSFEHAAPEQSYVVLLTYLPLTSARCIPRFLLHTARITAQLHRSRGLLGYSLRAEPAAKRFWTLSAWQDEASLQDFVQARPHARTMAALAPHIGATRFIRWTLTGAQLPPRWEEALARWREEG